MAFHSGAQRCAENTSVRPGWPTRLSAGRKGLGQTRISLTWLAGRTVVISATTIPFILSEFVFMSRIGPFSKSQTVRFDKEAANSTAAVLPSGSRGPAIRWPEGSGAPLAVNPVGSDAAHEIPYLAPAARRVLASSMARVMGPTPPGTGVMYDALSTTASKSTSPTILPFSSRLMPISMTTAPCFT